MLHKRWHIWFLPLCPAVPHIANVLKPYLICIAAGGAQYLRSFLSIVNVHSVNYLNCFVHILMSTVVPFRSELLYLSKQRGSKPLSRD